MYTFIHMRRHETQKDQVVRLAREKGILRIRDVRNAGLHPETVRRMCQQGVLEKAGSGLYRLADADITMHHTFALASKKAPQGVVCLLSALLFHEISTQLPHQVWMAFPRTARAPKLEYPRLRVVRFSQASLDAGIEVHYIENVRVQVTVPAKTIADCFKFRNKIGLEAALDALRDGIQDRKCTRDDVWHYARINRVGSVIEPFLEAIQ